MEVSDSAVTHTLYSLQTLQLIWHLSLIAPQGFRQEGEIPWGHPGSSRLSLTVKIYSQYARKNLDLLDLELHGIVR